ncbi:MAG: type II toxin-antitoxin system RelE family toxin [Methylophilaceae bacterium]
MAWKIRFDPAAERELDKLDRPIASRILKFLTERLAPSDNPRSLGAPLTGSKLGGFWKYRIGKYRVIASIEDEAVTILVLKVDKRSDVYKQK